VLLSDLTPEECKRGAARGEARRAVQELLHPAKTCREFASALQPSDLVKGGEIVARPANSSGCDARPASCLWANGEPRKATGRGGDNTRPRTPSDRWNRIEYRCYPTRSACDLSAEP
jgi:hypothetical protein